MSLHIVDEIDQLCQLYNEANTNEEKRRLLDILKEKRSQISAIRTKLNIVESKLKHVLEPPSASPNLYSGYNVYNI